MTNKYKRQRINIMGESLNYFSVFEHDDMLSKKYVDVSMNRNDVFYDFNCGI